MNVHVNINKRVEFQKELKFILQDKRHPSKNWWFGLQANYLVLMPK